MATNQVIYHDFIRLYRIFGQNKHPTTFVFIINRKWSSFNLCYDVILALSSTAFIVSKSVDITVNFKSTFHMQTMALRINGRRKMR